MIPCQHSPCMTAAQILVSSKDDAGIEEASVKLMYHTMLSLQKKRERAARKADRQQRLVRASPCVRACLCACQKIGLEPQHCQA